MKPGILISMLGILSAALPAAASPHELRLPLHDGKLELADISGSPLCPLARAGGRGAINLRGCEGSLFLQAVDASLGNGCRITVSDDALILHFDSEKLPQSRRALRTFVATENPEATALQARRWGLFLPERVDVSKPLVILTHGLDCDGSMLLPMGRMLDERGVQVAYFCYPGDQALADDVNLLEQRLADLHDNYPGIRIDLIGHSMGGLIARAYVEGDDYRGDVDHLIMVGTPNSGSGWARLHPLLKAQKQIALARTDPDWRWSWMVTEGLGEGARDVLPHSDFLDRLNAHSRRQGVRYTIVAGSHSSVATFGAECTRGVASWVPSASRSWWGIRQLESGLAQSAQRLASSTSQSDGPVSVRSTRLAGVKDMVVLPADHCSLVLGSAGSPPAALAVILDRLGVAPIAQ